MSAMYLFFFKVSRGYTEAQASILLLVYLVAGIAGAPSTGLLARRIGKHRALLATTTAYSLGLSHGHAIPESQCAGRRADDALVRLHERRLRHDDQRDGRRLRR